MRAIVSVLGTDKPGIIARISAVLFEARANILDISQTVLRDEVFAMTMFVDLSAITTSFEDLTDRLSVAGKELGMEIRLQREEIFQSMHKI